MRDGKTDLARAKCIEIFLDRGWGKPAQTVNANTDDKRHATDWSRAELVAFLNEFDMRASREPSLRGNQCRVSGRIRPGTHRGIS